MESITKVKNASQQHQTKSFKGMVLSFDEGGYQNCISIWESHLLPIILLIISEYNNLEILGKFSADETYILRSGNINRLRKAYEDAVIEDVDHVFKSRTAKRNALMNIELELDPIRMAVCNLYECISAFSFPIDWKDLEIVDGKPKIDRESIKRKYQIVIEDDEQNELYAKMIELKRSWYELKHFVNEKGYDTSRHPFTGKYGFFKEDEESDLVINPNSINYLQRIREYYKEAKVSNDD